MKPVILPLILIPEMAIVVFSGLIPIEIQLVPLSRLFLLGVFPLSLNSMALMLHIIRALQSQKILVF